MIEEFWLQLDWILWIGVSFLTLSLVFGFLSAARSAMADPAAGTSAARVEGMDSLGPLLEALTGLIAALGKAPAWFALFLAGLSLVWVAGSIANGTVEGDETDSPPVSQPSPKPSSSPSPAGEPVAD